MKAGVNAVVVEAFDINDTANDVYEHNFGHRPHQVSLLIYFIYCLSCTLCVVNWSNLWGLFWFLLSLKFVWLYLWILMKFWVGWSFCNYWRISISRDVVSKKSHLVLISRITICITWNSSYVIMNVQRRRQIGLLICLFVTLVRLMSYPSLNFLTFRIFYKIYTCICIHTTGCGYFMISVPMFCESYK